MWVKLLTLTFDEWANKISRVCLHKYDFCLYARAQSWSYRWLASKQDWCIGKVICHVELATHKLLCVSVCMCVGALAKLNAGCCWICNSPLKGWGMPSSSLRESEVLPGAQDEWCSCANIQHLFTHKKAHTKAKRWWSKYLGVRARASAACRVIYLFKGRRRARYKLKRRRERAPRMAPAAESFFPDEKGKPPPPIQRRLY